MSALDSDIRTEVIEVLTSSITGFNSGATSGSVYEYELEDGLFLGVAPRDEESTIATIYVYIADLAEYTDDSTALKEHPTITNLLYDLDSLLVDAFDPTDIDMSTFPEKLNNITEDGTPGRYYAMDIPRETAAA